MSRVKFGTAALAAGLLLATAAQATTREIADLQTAPLTLRRSVVNELSSTLLNDPFDEFWRRPYNLQFVNLERHGNLSPWPGQEGEQNRYINALIGNNGNTDVQNGSDVFQGTYIQQSMAKFTWGVAAAYQTDDITNSSATGPQSFADGEQVSGGDIRFGFGIRVTDRITLGGGLSATRRGSDVTDRGFEEGLGGFDTLQEVQQTGVEGDFGFRLFSGKSTSWEAQLRLGTGDTDVNDYSNALDAGGAVAARIVNTEYALTDTYAQLSGAYHLLYDDHLGELQVELGFRGTGRELGNSELSYLEAGGGITPTLTLLEQDPIRESEIFASAGTLFVRGWTQMFAGARLGFAKVDGTTTVDSLGTIVVESIDDTRTRLSLNFGLRQPLWNEKFRLIAGAQADWTDDSRLTIVDDGSIGTDFSQTATSYRIGIETVLSNLNFDLAWLFGESRDPGGSGDARRQVIEVNRLVISATLGW